MAKINQVEKIDGLKEQITKCDIKKSKYEVELEQITTKMWEEYELTPNAVKDYKKPENVANTQRKVNVLYSSVFCDILL